MFSNLDTLKSPDYLNIFMIIINTNKNIIKSYTRKAQPSLSCICGEKTNLLTITNSRKSTCPLLSESNALSGGGEATSETHRGQNFCQTTASVFNCVPNSVQDLNIWSRKCLDATPGGKKSLNWLQAKLLKDV